VEVDKTTKLLPSEESLAMGRTVNVALLPELIQPRKSTLDKPRPINPIPNQCTPQPTIRSDGAITRESMSAAIDWPRCHQYAISHQLTKRAELISSYHDAPRAPTCGIADHDRMATYRSGGWNREAQQSFIEIGCCLFLTVEGD
jgi:hypothetical protein